MFILKRRQQNQKFPSFQILRFAAGGVGGAANKNDRKFLGFAPRELVERGRGASVIRQNPADFARNTFELRPIHTAKTHRFDGAFREGASQLLGSRGGFEDRSDVHSVECTARGGLRPSRATARREL